MMTTMDIRDTSEVIRVLSEAAAERSLSEPDVWRVETFTMHRASRKHGYQNVTVKILDRGPDFSPRYHVSAQTPEGQRCTGNPNDDLEVALRTVHWFELDK